MSDDRVHLLDLEKTSLLEQLVATGLERYRADQILQWIYRRGAQSFDEMTNLSKALRQRLSEEAVLYTSHVERRAESTDGTVKLLLRWPDGATCECVMIPDGPRRTVCVSTQVGCPVGCAFCASGLHGLERNLTAGEIVEQAMRAWLHLPEDPSTRPAKSSDRPRITHVVLMGIGEPLANYAATTSAIRTINADWGMNVGARRITVSTVGLPKQIRRLADEGLQIGLAISLHAPNDALRREIVPWAERTRIDELVQAARDYFDRTGREVTLEYVLLGGINDRPTHARQLVTVAHQMRCNVNLIRYNAVAGLSYERPTRDAAHAFAEILRKAGVNTHLRASRGTDIEAACGQLRRQRSDL